MTIYRSTSRRDMPVKVAALVLAARRLGIFAPRKPKAVVKECLTTEALPFREEK